MTDHQILEVILSELKEIKDQLRENRKEMSSFKETQTDKMFNCRREVDKEISGMKLSMMKLILIASASGATGGIAGKLLTIF